MILGKRNGKVAINAAATTEKDGRVHSQLAVAGDSAAGTQAGAETQGQTKDRTARECHGGGLELGKQEGLRGTGHPVRSGRGHTGLSLVAPKSESPGRDESCRRPSPSLAVWGHIPGATFNLWTITADRGLASCTSDLQLAGGPATHGRLCWGVQGGLPRRHLGPTPGAVWPPAISIRGLSKVATWKNPVNQNFPKTNA